MLQINEQQSLQDKYKALELRNADLANKSSSLSSQLDQTLKIIDQINNDKTKLQNSIESKNDSYK